MANDKIEWTSHVEKKQEWEQARQRLFCDGILMPDGSKLRRKDSGLNHSFIVAGGKILALSGKGIYISNRNHIKLKIAEDDSGGIYALKIIKDMETPSEGKIAFDLGKAMQATSRTLTYTRKHYIPYRYLGITMRAYLEKNNDSHELSVDRLFELAIKIVWALHELHTGLRSKTGAGYAHSDVNLSNITIDETESIHFIDYEISSSLDDTVHQKFFTVNPAETFKREQQRDVVTLMRTLCPSGNAMSPYNNYSQSIVTQAMLAESIDLQDLFNLPRSGKIPSALELCEKLTLIRCNFPGYSERGEGDSSGPSTR